MASALPGTVAGGLGPNRTTPVEAPGATSPQAEPSASSGGWSTRPSAATRPTRLDERTKLGFRVGGTVYPSAGEGSIYLRGVFGGSVDGPSDGAREPEDGERAQSRSDAMPSTADRQPPACASRPETAERAGRRARGQVRRYCVTNGCTRLVTLTRADQTHDRRQVVRDVQRWARELRARHPTIAYLWTLERHQSGALHVHVALSSYVPKGELARLWGRGFVDVRKIRAGGGRESARVAARYVSKYVAKAPASGPGEHRYEVRQGRQPVAVRVLGETSDQVRTELVRAMWGELPSYESESSSWTAWTGPPVTFLAWS